MQKLYMICFIILLLIISFFVGKYIYKITKIDEMLLAKERYEVNLLEENNNENLKITSANNNIKISPNAIIIFKIEYGKCGHVLNEYRNVYQQEVNLTKSEIENLYETWEVVSFSEKEIVLLKKLNESCNQHFIIKEKDGDLAIYVIDEQGNLLLKEVTNISTKYLTEVDMENLQTGIRVNGIEELNAKLEDFE